MSQRWRLMYTEKQIEKTTNTANSSSPGACIAYADHSSRIRRKTFFFLARRRGARVAVTATPHPRRSTCRLTPPSSGGLAQDLIRLGLCVVHRRRCVRFAVDDLGQRRGERTTVDLAPVRVVAEVGDATVRHLLGEGLQLRVRRERLRVGDQRLPRRQQGRRLLLGADFPERHV